MPPDEQSISLAIQARDRAHEVIGQSTRDIERYATALKLAKQEGDRTNEGNRRMGEIIANLNGARARQRDAMQTVQQSTVSLTDAQAKLRDMLTQAGEQLAGQAGTTGRIVAGFGGIALAGAAVAGALTAVVGASIAASHAIGDFQERQDILGDQLDLTQREIGGLTLGAANVGRSFDSIQPSLFIFTRRLGEARSEGGAALKTFTDLGINPQKDLRTTGEILGAIANALDTVGDKAVRNKLLVELFGRGGSQVLPVLRQNFDELKDAAEKSGITLSESAQKTAREADLAWDRLRASVGGLRNSVLVSLAPLGTEVAKIMNSIVNSIKGVSDVSENTDLAKAIAQFDRLHKMAQEGAIALDEQARAQERLNAMRRAGLAIPEGAKAVIGRPPEDPSAPPRAPVVFERQTGSSGGLGIPAVGDVAGIVQEQGTIFTLAGQISAEAQKQLETTKKTIELLALRHSLGVQTIDDEIQTLQPMRAQVLSRQELEKIETAIRELRSKAPPSDIELNFAPPTFEDQKPRIQELNKEIELMDRRRALLSEGVDDEIKALEARRENVKSSEELLLIDQKIAELQPLAQRRVFGPTITPEQAKSIGLPKGVVPEAPIRKTTSDYVVAIDRSIQAVASFTTAMQQGTQSAISSFGQLAASVLATIGALTRNSALGPIGALIGTVTSIVASRGHQEGGRVPPPSAVALQAGGRYAPSATVRLQTGGAISHLMAPVLTMQSGGRMLARAAATSAIALQVGGVLGGMAALPRPLYAQSGLVLSGARGLDTEHALLGRGEMVVSHTETEFIQSVLGQVQRALNRPAAAAAGPTSSVTFGEGAIQINVRGGGRQDWRRIVNEEIIPEFRRAVLLGTSSR